MDESLVIGKKSGDTAALDGWQGFANTPVVVEVTRNRPG
jgi:hypothetical protein